MAKVIDSVTIQIKVARDEAGEVTVSESADLEISTEEYPEFKHRKGIPIVLGEAQETAIINHVKNTVLPQAEAAK